MSNSSPAAASAGTAPTRRSTADFLPILFCLVFWAWNTPIYVYLERHGCDAYTMAFYRTLTAAIMVAIWELAVSGGRAMQEEFRRQRGWFLLLAFFFIAGMYGSVAGTVLTSATMGVLIGRGTPLVALSLCALLYADERRLIRRIDFLLGFAIAVAGLLGLSLMHPAAAAPPAGTLAASAQHVQAAVVDAGRALTSAVTHTPAAPIAGSGGEHYSLGILLLLMCALMWGSYSATVKNMVVGARPFTITAITFAMAAGMAFPMMLWQGNPGWVLHAGLWPLLVLLSSGLLMGVAEGMFYLSVNRLGLAPSTSATLLVPFGTALIAWLFLDEQITVTLVAFGGLLLMGLGIIVRSRSRLLAGETMQQPILPAGRAEIAPISVGRVSAEKE